MKKNVLVIAGLAVLSTNAFASKARMQALGQGNVSFYMNDTRSVFLNPASLNDTKNYIVTEWGKNSETNPFDQSTAQRAEGGFFREMGAFSYGLYLGNNDNASGIVHGQTYKEQANAADLFVAGDMGMKWGAKVHYASRKDESGLATDTKNSALGIGLGVMHGDIEGYLNLDLSDKTTGDGAAKANESKVTGSMQLGGSYKLSGWTLFGDYTAGKLENAGVAKNYELSDIRVGVGRVHELSNGLRLVTDATYVMRTDKNHTADNGALTAIGLTDDKVETTALPVTLGFEGDATSWLTLRGSVSQCLMGQYKTAAGRKWSPDTIGVNAGATLNFGKLKVDGVIGTNNDTGHANTSAGQKTSVLALDKAMANVAATYSF